MTVGGTQSGVYNMWGGSTGTTYGSNIHAKMQASWVWPPAVDVPEGQASAKR